MYDQSFSVYTLEHMLRQSDYRQCPSLGDHKKKAAILAAAKDTAHTMFQGQSPLSTFVAGSKAVYQVKDMAHTLIVRKLRENLISVIGKKQPNRDSIVINLRHFLAEGVAYRVYRLDLVSFYESFNTEEVIERVHSLSRLSALSKNLIEVLLKSYIAAGGKGIPRGVTFSAALSELMMHKFDRSIRCSDGVYLYYRYVDDVVIITDDEVKPKKFIQHFARTLPSGHRIHNQKRTINYASTLPKLQATPVPRFRFDYLGYCFSVLDPVNDGNAPRDRFRTVCLDIADVKVKKLKTRIIKSFHSFQKGNDFPLLELRIRFLTSNLRIDDFAKNTTKLAGIYQNYRHIESGESKQLEALDRFLHNAISSPRGRLFSRTSRMLSRTNRAKLSAYSFVKGHKNRCFYHFSPVQLRKIVECWSHD